jgi:hypothetical protein
MSLNRTALVCGGGDSFLDSRPSPLRADGSVSEAACISLTQASFQNREQKKNADVIAYKWNTYCDFNGEKD